PLGQGLPLAQRPAPVPPTPAQTRPSAQKNGHRQRLVFFSSLHPPAIHFMQDGHRVCVRTSAPDIGQWQQISLDGGAEPKKVPPFLLPMPPRFVGLKPLPVHPPLAARYAFHPSDVGRHTASSSPMPLSLPRI